MTDHSAGAVDADGAKPEGRPGYWRYVVWIVVGAILAAAFVSVVWVLTGNQGGVIGRAFVTIVLLTLFSGAALLDANLADRRPQWYVVLSMIGWVVLLLVGAVKIWAPMGRGWGDSGAVRTFEFLLVVLIVRLAVLHIWLYLRGHLARATVFTHVVAIVTVALVGVLAVLLVLPLTFSSANFVDFYWRVAAATAILAAVATAIVPLVRLLTEPPRRERRVVPPAPAVSYPAASPAATAPLGWPTYPDGRTPLPVLPDGTPAWYVLGHVAPAPASAPAPAPLAAPAPQLPPPYVVPASAAAPVPPVPPVPPLPPVPSAPAAQPMPAAESSNESEPTP